VWGPWYGLLTERSVRDGGKITSQGILKAKFDLRPRRFRLTLQAEDYSKANVAHEQGERSKGHWRSRHARQPALPGRSTRSIIQASE